MSESGSISVSIIIAYYNSSEFIQKALEFAEKQRGISKEIIVVDDGSDDYHKRELKRHSNRIDLLLTQENRGQGSARNLAIVNAKGKYILNWDSDDYFEPEFSEIALEKFTIDPKVKIVTCHALRTSDCINGEIVKPLGGNYKNFLFDNAALGSAMFKREDWERVHGYDESQSIRGFEDWDFYLRVLYPAGLAVVIPKLLFTYYRHQNSTTIKISNFRMDRRQYIYTKNSEIYKNHYAELMGDIFRRLKKEEFEKNKNKQRLEYRLGDLLLKPLRILKRLFN